MLPNDNISMSVGHLDHILIVYSLMEHVTWKSPGPTCGWVGRNLHPDSCTSVFSWSKVLLLSIWPILPLSKYAYEQIAVMLSPNFLSMGAKVPRNKSSMEWQFLGHSLLRSESSTGTKVPWRDSSWTLHSTGANVPGNESSICGLFAARNESVEEWKVQIQMQ